MPRFEPCSSRPSRASPSSATILAGCAGNGVAAALGNHVRHARCRDRRRPPADQ